MHDNQDNEVIMSMLLEPLSVGELELPNRAIMAPLKKMMAIAAASAVAKRQRDGAAVCNRSRPEGAGTPRLDVS